MLVLALDTATPAITAGVAELLLPHELTAALAAGGADGAADGEDAGGAPPQPVTVLAEQVADDAFGHAEKLVPLVHAALAAAGRELADLVAVVVGLGPGPFTGLRVGIVTAAALGDGLDVPVHGVPSHDAVARSCPGGAPLLVVTDARRREVHVSGYDAAGRRVTGPLVLPPAQVAAVAAGLGEGVRVCGPGVPLVADLADLPVVTPGPLTGGLVAAAAQPLLTGAVPGPLTPLYLREADVSAPGAPRSVLAAGQR